MRRSRSEGTLGPVWSLLSRLQGNDEDDFFIFVSCCCALAFYIRSFWLFSSSFSIMSEIGNHVTHSFQQSLESEIYCNVTFESLSSLQCGIWFP
jgi:hypothetical protein